MPDDRLVPEPTVFILFGATGDLAHRLVLPAFFRLAQAGLLPEDWRLVGNGRGDVSHEDFQDRVRDSLEEFGPKPSEGPWDEFSVRGCVSPAAGSTAPTRQPCSTCSGRPKPSSAAALNGSTTLPYRPSPWPR